MFFSILSTKGGVGKTTLTAIGGILADFNQVLLVEAEIPTLNPAEETL